MAVWQVLVASTVLCVDPARNLPVGLGTALMLPQLRVQDCCKEAVAHPAVETLPMNPDVYNLHCHGSVEEMLAVMLTR
jgi:hypothetical protein